MKQKLKCVLLVLLGLAFLQLACAEVSLTITPVETHLGYNQSVTLEVRISGVEAAQPMRGFEMTVIYDPAYLTTSSVAIVEGTFLSDFATEEYGTKFYAIGTPGAFSVAGAILSVPPEHDPPSPWGAVGDGLLFTVTMTSLTTPNCYTPTLISLSNIILKDEVNQPIIPASVTGAEIYVHPKQIIPLHTGWNLISSWVIPENLPIDAVFATLRNAGYLVKVQDEYGRAYVQDVFGTWLNNIGDYQMHEGYYVKVNANCELVINGNCVILPMTVELHTGWNIIPFPYHSSKTAMSVLQPLIDANLLIKAQDEYGLAIVQDIYGSWLDNIGDFEEGEGYYIKVSANTSIIYPVPNRANQEFIDKIDNNEFNDANNF